MDLNKVMLIGRLTQDPEMRTIPSGQNVTSFSLATNRRWKNQATGELQEEVQFHNIVAWGKLAEICAQYMKKGMRIFVEGRLQTRSWDDQQTGKKNYRTEIVAENAIMLDRKDTTSVSQSTDTSSQSPTSAAKEEVNVPAPEQIPTIDIDEDKEEIKIEDIPF